MKISHTDLMKLDSQGYITIQSEAPEITYVIDRRNKVLWIINRQTGAQLEISGENVYKFADEMMSVAEVHLGEQALRKGA